MSKFGGWAYERLLTLSRRVNRVRRWMNPPYWSLAAAAKAQTKRDVQYIADFERAVVQRAVQRQVDGIICCHIHVPALPTIRGIAYANTGDWIESCTALVEPEGGRIALQGWSQVPSSQTVSASAFPRRGDGAAPSQSSPPGTIDAESPESPERPSA